MKIFKDLFKNFKLSFLSIAVIVGFIGVVVFAKLQCNKNDKLNDELDNKSVMLEDLKQYKNKYNQEVSEKGVIILSISELNKLDASKDSLIQELQKIVKHKTVSATVITNQTHEQGTSGVTIVSHETSTVTNGNQTVITDYPVYRTEWSSKWSKGIITASKDTVTRDITMFNEYDIVQQYSRSGLFGKKKLNISITNKNPNTETLNAQSFLIQQPKQHKGFWAVLGAGITAATFVALKL